MTGRITDFRDSVIDFLGKTTGWSQQPSLINQLLKNISDEAMHQATNISDLLKQSLDSLNDSAKDLSEWFKDMARSIDRTENAVPQRSDPLVLDLDGDGVELIALDDSKVFFDLDNDGFKERVGLVSGDDGILVLDANHNNNVDNATELFGYKDQDGHETVGSEELRIMFIQLAILISQI